MGNYIKDIYNPCICLWVSFLQTMVYASAKRYALKKKKKGFVVKFRICYKSYPPPLQSTLTALSCPAVKKPVSTWSSTFQMCEQCTAINIQ